MLKKCPISSLLLLLILLLFVLADSGFQQGLLLGTSGFRVDSCEGERSGLCEEFIGESEDNSAHVNATITEDHTTMGLENTLYHLVPCANNTSENMARVTIRFVVLVDVEPPEIVHFPVTDGVEGQAITIYAMITDNVAVTEASLHYRRTGETSYIELNMTECEGCIDTYNATIPSSAMNVATIEYYIEASDGTNHATHPATSPAENPHTISIDLRPTPVVLSDPSDITEDSLKLSWTESVDDDFKNYTIHQSSIQGTLGDPINTITDKSANSYTATDLSSDTAYYFTIRVFDEGGLYTDSNQVMGKTNPQAFPWMSLAIVLIILTAATVLILVTRGRWTKG